MISNLISIEMWIVYLLFVFPLILLGLRKLYITAFKEYRNVCVLVLGDLGRSPRMQYHAMSLAKEGFTVDLIGYPGSVPPKGITENPRIRIHYLSPPPELGESFPRLVCYVIKTLWRTHTLLWALFHKRVSSYVLLQNPPAIPTIPICWLYCLVMDSQFIIDWHNYAHTLMALSLTDDHLLVKFAQFVETFLGFTAHRNFCVSKAMKEDLRVKWKIEAEVLYDRPPEEFHTISLLEKHLFFLELSEQYDVFKGEIENSTVFTEYSSDEVRLSPKRPGFIVSSTSWTEDEDFSILLNALQEYENAIGESCNLPNLICVITGKGPLKEFYMAIIQMKNWKHVKVITPWLESQDYPRMIASADLGICLHTSSSGLDLPMKVVDMFGCELPVCAYNFKCLPELVKHNENGMIFSTEKELVTQLKLWFENFPNNDAQHKLDERFRQELHRFQENRWHSNWTSIALPYFNE